MIRGKRILVHGGGKLATSLAEKLGIETKTIRIRTKPTGIETKLIRNVS